MRTGLDGCGRLWLGGPLLLFFCACGGSSSSGSGEPSSSDGGASSIEVSAQAGSGAAAAGGASAAAQPAPDLHGPVPTCAETLALSDVVSCTSLDDCGPSAMSCSVAPDCSQAWCSDGLEGYPCFRHSDCQQGFVCGGVLPGSVQSGNCVAPGEARAPCRGSDDCQPGTNCVLFADDYGLCTSGADTEPCAVAADCASGYCVHDLCTTGLAMALCDSDADCVSYCSLQVDQSYQYSLRLCGDGSRDSACEENEDCQSGHCLITLSGWGECPDGSICSADTDCGGQSCSPRPRGWGTCPDGKLCVIDEDCRPDLCTPDPHVLAGGIFGTCDDGQLSMSCFDDADCASGRCVGASVSGYGACADGSLGAPCDDDATCDSGICVNDKQLGQCGDGAPGSSCIDDADCLSASCTLQPGGGLPGSCDP